MDKEAQEKIAEARLTYIILNWRDNLDNTRMTPQELAQTLKKVLTEEFGYRKFNKKEIEHILETQRDLCELGKSDKDDGSCSLCRSIKEKLESNNIC